MEDFDAILGDVNVRRMVGAKEIAVRNIVVDDTERTMIASGDNLISYKWSLVI